MMICFSQLLNYRNVKAQSLKSQARFMLQTMTFAGELGEPDNVESDCSGGLAQHHLTKHPENKQQNCESFILEEDRRANGMAQRG